MTIPQGHEVSGSGRFSRTFELNASEYRQLRVAAERQGTTISGWIRATVRAALDREAPDVL